MSKHNYSQYSKKNDNKIVEEKKPIQPIEVVNEVIPEPVIAEPVAEVKMEPKREVETRVKGAVVNCAKLNVREKPNTDANILAVLDNGAEVVIDTARSTHEWVKITTAVGIEGFCMRKFVSAKA